MGKGRKTMTHSVKGNYEVNWARNLPFDKLGAVIFGCKNHTITECLDKKIFGLPAAHYRYVKNIAPGLPLFLFNYSDRLLHGIYKAASSGEMNICQYSWIDSEGTETTPYPAQVRVCDFRKCYPLSEEKFKPLLAKNYYEERLFQFELDREQCKSLMTLFLSSPMPEKVPRPPNPSLQSNLIVVSSGSSVTETADARFKNLDSEKCSGTSKDACGSTWADLLKPSLPSFKNKESLEPQKVILDSTMSDCLDMEGKLPSSFESSEQAIECYVDSANTESDSDVVEWGRDPPFLENDSQNKTYQNELLLSQYHGRESDTSDLTDIPSENNSYLDKEVGYGLAGNAIVPLENCERVYGRPNLTDGACQEDNFASSEALLMGIQSCNLHSVIVQLLQETERLRVSQLEQRQKIDCLERELVDHKIEIDQLRNKCRKLEYISCFARDNNEGAASSFIEKSVFLVGGFDGKSWLSDLSLYSPSQDYITTLSPMTFPRSHPAAAKLNGELYIYGGGYDGSWVDIVESYNPDSDVWLQRPSLSRSKGSLAGASVYGKIFAIGGGNGVECFSEVEVFDPNLGSWICTQSMLEKRFASAAAELNGVLYVAGGFDGKYYMRTVERFDPRERSWTRLSDMNIRRGCHSLVPYKEKLFAIGGYDGDTMVPFVEVLDPRCGLWMEGAPMANSRGYSGSFVSGEKIYVVGGVQDGQILDVTECYTYESGWQTTGTRAVGKRSSFSTLVL